MGCRDSWGGYGGDYDDGLSKDYDALARYVCALFKKGMKPPAELRDWWRRHQEDDARREAQEEAEQRRRSERAGAIAKLTPHERKVLNLDM